MRKIPHVIGVVATAGLTAAASMPASAAPTTTRVSGTLNAVAAVSAADAWAVGSTNSNGPLIMHWNGSAWTQAAGLGTKNGDLRGVAVASADDVWAVGNVIGGGTLIMHWNGTAWHRVPSPHGDLLLGVTATSARNAWAVGTTRHASLLLHWNGIAWERVAAPGSPLSAVTATSARNAWAVGQGARGMLILHWNGVRWARARVPAVKGMLFGVAATSAKNAWAAGVGFQTRRSGCDFGCPLILHWNGRSWRAQPTANPPSQPNGNWLFADTATAGVAWAVGGTSITSPGGGTFILRLANGRWRRVPSPGPAGSGTNLFGVAATSARNAWAVGFTTQRTPFVAVILRWNGTAWKRVL
jgi:hypothetical protein